MGNTKGDPKKRAEKTRKQRELRQKRKEDVDRTRLFSKKQTTLTSTAGFLDEEQDDENSQSADESENQDCNDADDPFAGILPPDEDEGDNDNEAEMTVAGLRVNQLAQIEKLYVSWLFLVYKQNELWTVENGGRTTIEPPSLTHLVQSECLNGSDVQVMFFLPRLQFALWKKWNPDLVLTCPNTGCNRALVSKGFRIRPMMGLRAVEYIAYQRFMCRQCKESSQALNKDDPARKKYHFQGVDYITNNQRSEHCVAEIEDLLRKDKDALMAVDTEWLPLPRGRTESSLTTQERRKHRIALCQIGLWVPSMEKYRVWLFHISRFTHGNPTPGLIRLLCQRRQYETHPSEFMIYGANINLDSGKFEKDFGAVGATRFSGTMELTAFCKQNGMVSRDQRMMSMVNLSKSQLGLGMNKQDDIRCSLNNLNGQDAIELQRVSLGDFVENIPSTRSRHVFKVTKSTYERLRSAEFSMTNEKYSVVTYE